MKKILAMLVLTFALAATVGCGEEKKAPPAAGTGSGSTGATNAKSTAAK